LSAVQKAIKTGRIQATAERKIDSEAADQSWATATDPAKQRKEPPPPPLPAPMPLLDGAPQEAPPMRRPTWPEWPEPWPPPVASPPPTALAAPGGTNVTSMDTFVAAKTERERAEAELAKIALLEKQGKLISAEEARQTWRAIGKMFAQVRENIPTDLATKLVGKTEPREIEVLIRTAFREADKKVADEIQSRFADVVDDVRYGSIAG
jgi:hypothetical protein